MAYIRYKLSCLGCKLEFAYTQFPKHVNGNYCSNKPKTVIEGVCQYCKEDISHLAVGKKKKSGFVFASHVKWCKANPDRGKGHTLNSPQLNTPESIEKRKAGIKKAHAEGKYTKAQISSRGVPRKPHSEETKKKISEKARASDHQRVSKRTHEFIDKRGRKFKFDSTWEDEFAKRLDILDIEWTRPDPISYTSEEGRTRKYFPDFYLPQYDLYVDPKNSYAEKTQKEKLDIVSKIINLEILRSKESCSNWNPKN